MLEHEINVRDDKGLEKSVFKSIEPEQGSLSANYELGLVT